MKNPCTRDCPDRHPGCECEKRRAWKFQQKKIQEARKQAILPDAFLMSSGMRKKARRIKMRKDWKNR